MCAWVDLVDRLAGPARLWTRGFQCGDAIEVEAIVPPNAVATVKLPDCRHARHWTSDRERSAGLSSAWTTAQKRSRLRGLETRTRSDLVEYRQADVEVPLTGEAGGDGVRAVARNRPPVRAPRSANRSAVCLCGSSGAFRPVVSLDYTNENSERSGRCGGRGGGRCVRAGEVVSRLCFAGSARMSPSSRSLPATYRMQRRASRRAQDGRRSPWLARPRTTLGPGSGFRIRDEAVSPFLLVEGADLDDPAPATRMRFGAHSWRSSTWASRCCEVGIQRIPRCGSIGLRRVSRGSPATRPPPGSSPIEAPGVEVLTAVPGISTQTARALIAHV